MENSALKKRASQEPLPVSTRLSNARLRLMMFMLTAASMLSFVVGEKYVIKLWVFVRQSLSEIAVTDAWYLIWDRHLKT